MDLLTGIKVVDFSGYYPGPYATLRLQEWGATVIKVEPPAGDYARVFRRPAPDVEGNVFQSWNRGKECVVFNLKDPDDLAKCQDLVKDADVIVEGFRPGVMGRLGLGYEDVKAVNPGVVYVSISGYGATGSLASKSGHDLNYLALAGVLSQLRGNDGVPIFPNVLFCDTTTGIVASEAILAGLVKRSLDPNHEGCYFDISMTEAVLGLMQNALGENVLGNMPRYSLRCVNFNVYETSDGRFVTLAAMEPKFWKAFCDAVDRPDLIKAFETPTTEDNPFYRRMVALFKGRTFDEWVQFFYDEDCCFAPVLDADEIEEFPLFAERSMIESRDGFTFVKPHYEGDGVPLRDYENFMPKLGQNTLGL